MLRSKTNLTGGIVGLANVGKSTFFQAITRSKLGNPANFPFATIEPEEAKVVVPSPRLSTLANFYNSKALVPASFNVVDIAGLVRGASKGDGLGNAFLANIRAVDGIFQMVRSFDDEDIVHIENSVDPIRDAQIINDELVLKDMEFVMKAIEQGERKLRSTPSTSPAGVEAKEMMDVCSLAMKALDSGKRVDQAAQWSSEKHGKYLRQLNLLTMKPTVYIANISEEDWCFGNPMEHVKLLEDWVQSVNPGSPIVPLSVNFESRLSQLSDDQAESELNELGVKSNLPKIITSLRSRLGLQSFFTVGPGEAREWTIKAGSTAPEAASVIHEDLSKTFITAQVIKYSDCVKYKGDENALKKAGKIATKGKDYLVEDGDILEIRAAGARKK